jgi:hypothetical protein
MLIRRWAVPALHAAWGCALLCAPGRILAAAAGRRPAAAAPPGSRAAAVLRLLGARHLGQAVITAARPSRAVYTLGAAADLLHAASCLALAAADRRWRHAGIAGGTGAAAFGIADAAAARLTQHERALAPQR